MGSFLCRNKFLRSKKKKVIEYVAKILEFYAELALVAKCTQEELGPKNSFQKKIKSP
jgi:hypothetical protein